MGISFVVTIQPLEGSLIVEMNIEHSIAVRQFQCCGAANTKVHSKGKVSLTGQQCCPIGRQRRLVLGRAAKKSPESIKFVAIQTQETPFPENSLRSAFFNYPARPSQ
jgi:hypothetical protein